MDKIDAMIESRVHGDLQEAVQFPSVSSQEDAINFIIDSLLGPLSRSSQGKLMMQGVASMLAANMGGDMQKAADQVMTQMKERAMDNPGDFGIDEEATEDQIISYLQDFASSLGEIMGATPSIGTTGGDEEEEPDIDDEEEEM